MILQAQIVTLIDALETAAEAVPELLPLLAADHPLQRWLLVAASRWLGQFEQWGLDRKHSLAGLNRIWWLVGKAEMQPELTAQSGSASGQQVLRQVVDCAARLAPAWQLSADEMESELVTKLANAGLELMKSHITAAATNNPGDPRSATFPYALLPDSVVQQHLELVRLLAGMLRSLVQQRAAEIAAGGPQPPPGCQRTETDWLAANGMLLCLDLSELPQSGLQSDMDTELLQQVCQRQRMPLQELAATLASKTSGDTMLRRWAAALICQAAGDLQELQRLGSRHCLAICAAAEALIRATASEPQRAGVLTACSNAEPATAELSWPGLALAAARELAPGAGMAGMSPAAAEPSSSPPGTMLQWQSRTCRP